MFRGLLCLTVAAALCTTAWGAPAKIITGKVVSAAAGKLIVSKPDETELTFNIDQRTVVIIGGEPGRLEDLRRGSLVSLMYKDGFVVRVETVGER